MKLSLILSILLLFVGCVMTAFNLDPYTNLEEVELRNISYSDLPIDELERCLHINWTDKVAYFPLTTSFNSKGKILAFHGSLQSRFFAMEISEITDSPFKTKIVTAITSDITMTGKRQIHRKNLISTLNSCSKEFKWTTLKDD